MSEAPKEYLPPGGNYKDAVADAPLTSKIPNASPQAPDPKPYRLTGGSVG